MTLQKNFSFTLKSFNELFYSNMTNTNEKRAQDWGLGTTGNSQERSLQSTMIRGSLSGLKKSSTSEKQGTIKEHAKDYQ